MLNISPKTVQPCDNQLTRDLEHRPIKQRLTNMDLKELEEEFLTCPVCFELYRRPKQLPCLHTFCEQCLRKYFVERVEELFKEGNKQLISSVPCPVCRETAYVITSVEGPLVRLKADMFISSLRDNFYINNLLEKVRSTENAEHQLSRKAFLAENNSNLQERQDEETVYETLPSIQSKRCIDSKFGANEMHTLQARLFAKWTGTIQTVSSAMHYHRQIRIEKLEKKMIPSEAYSYRCPALDIHQCTLSRLGNHYAVVIPVNESLEKSSVHLVDLAKTDLQKCQRLPFFVENITPVNPDIGTFLMLIKERDRLHLQEAAIKPEDDTVLVLGERFTLHAFVDIATLDSEEELFGGCPEVGSYISTFNKNGIQSHVFFKNIERPRDLTVLWNDRVLFRDEHNDKVLMVDLKDLKESRGVVNGTSVPFWDNEITAKAIATNGQDLIAFIGLVRSEHVLHLFLYKNNVCGHLIVYVDGLSPSDKTQICISPWTNVTERSGNEIKKAYILLFPTYGNMLFLQIEAVD